MNRAIDLRQLRYFIAVAEDCSFRRAAERLHLTQPPLSRQVGELERALGVVLLARNTRSVRLTPAGEIALREFRSIVAAFDAALERVTATGSAAPRLRIGILYWYDMTGLAAFERELKGGGFVAGVDVQTVASHESIVALRRGSLDAALVAAPIDLRGLDAAMIGRVRHAAFVPAGSALARRRVLSLRELEEVTPFFRFPRGANLPLYDHFDRQYRKFGFRPRSEAPAQDALGVLARIAAGRGCTIMPEPMMRKRFPGVSARRLREEVTIDLALVFSPRFDAGLRAAVLKAARHLPAGPRGE
jgi:DNA-binding transcriptional LysR family regulator